MTVDFESLSDVLKHPIRKRIIQTLSQRNGTSYVDLMNLVEVNNTGKFNYHLKVLADLIAKDENGKYSLSDKGQLAVQFLQKFGQKEVEPTPLRMADAVMIGFVGCVLAAANPGFWLPFSIASFGVNVPTSFFSLIGFLGFAFALFIPGALMWLLTTRRAHSHDPYDLFKPPLVAFILLLVLTVTMIFLKLELSVTIATPVTDLPSGNPNQHVTAYSMMQTSLSVILLVGSVLSFLGVTIAELGSKIKKRIMH